RVSSRPGTTTMRTCGRTTAERFDRSPLDEWAPTNAKHPAGDWRCTAGGDQRGRGQQSNQDNLPVGNLIVNALWAFAGPCYSPPRTERGRFSESSATKTSPLLRRFSNNSLGFVQAVKALWAGYRGSVQQEHPAAFGPVSLRRRISGAAAAASSEGRLAILKCQGRGEPSFRGPSAT